MTIRRRIIAVVRALAAALMLCVCVGDLDAAWAGDAAVLIIDSSGSMSQRQGAETRLDAARSVIRTQVESWPKDRPLGLVAYGHRRASDCGDIETIQPVGPADVSAVETGLARLRARGKTPLAAALRHAAGLLPPDGGTILLVSDGLETCAQDPCAVADDLRKAHAGLIIHVIGFGMSAPDMQALACIAGKDGLSIGAYDQQALAQALTEAEESKAQPPPEAKPEPVAEPAPSPPPPPPIVAAPVHLVAMVGEEQVPGAVRWQVKRADGGDVYNGESGALDLALDPGAYRVAIEGSNAQGEADITVVAATDGQRAEHRVPIEAGLVRLSMVTAPGEDIAAADIKGAPAYRIEPLDNQPPATVLDAASTQAVLKPGRYRITGSIGSFSASREVTAIAGKVDNVAVDLGLGRITLEAAADGAEQPVSDSTGIDWSLAPEPQSAGNEAPLNAIATARPTLLAPAGRYIATLSIAGARIGQTVEVVAGKSITVRLHLPSASLTLEGALGPGVPAFDDWRDATWTVTPKSLIGNVKAGAAMENKAEARPMLTLTPGTWTVSLTSGLASTTRDLQIAPGGKVSERIELAAGRLAVTAAPAEGAPPPLNILFSVFAAKADGGFADKPIQQAGTNRDFSSILPAGRYRIDASDEQGRTASVTVDLVTGQRMPLALLIQ